MSSFTELLERRRSVRHYADRPVEKEKIDAIVKAALTAPTSKNQRSWHFTVVTDRALLEKLSEAKPSGGTFIKDAPLAIVVSGNTGNDMWVEDTSIAATVIQLAAESLGLGSCWVQMRGRAHSDSRSAGEYVRRVLSLPAENDVLCIVSMGYDRDERKPHPTYEDSDKVAFL